MKEKLVIIGGGGHARACLDIIAMHKHFEIIGIIDSYLVNSNIQTSCGYDVLGDESLLHSLNTPKKQYSAFVAIGQIRSPQPRMHLYHKLKSLGFKLPSFVSPLAYVASSSSIGEGSIIMHGALINANVQIGKMAIVNSKALIEHDCIVGDFCHLSTASVINGACTIGNQVFLGSNMTLKHKTHIADNSLLYCNPLEQRLRDYAHTDSTRVNNGGGGQLAQNSLERLIIALFIKILLYHLRHSILFILRSLR
ncbi:acetyltransferase [Helicobacter aurati]|uniref:Acetyltransferase n=1 Tax=Helicobacter aurati TaxID=137778 RepID=A0A3D8J073_9HELI|nr:NeuD/PglB/VioB family sugar acetyltransferase [Helicobacter aurati]RDU70616.1 acetyltransferase [Helicobacter aurati]